MMRETMKCRDSKECPSICRECADKKKHMLGSKHFFYCNVTGLPCREAVNECPYN